MVPDAGAVTSFSCPPSNVTCSVDPGVQPGPEVMSTLVPAGPEIGSSVTGGDTISQVSVRPTRPLFWSSAPPNIMNACRTGSQTRFGSSLLVGLGFGCMVMNCQAPSWSRYMLLLAGPGPMPPNR